MARRYRRRFARRSNPWQTWLGSFAGGAIADYALLSTVWRPTDEDIAAALAAGNPQRLDPDWPIKLAWSIGAPVTVGLVTRSLANALSWWIGGAFGTGLAIVTQADAYRRRHPELSGLGGGYDVLPIEYNPTLAPARIVRG